MKTLTHLDWQPVILLKILHLPFSNLGGLSLKRAYLALDEERLLYADWTLEAAERTEALVSITGWTLPSLPEIPTRLQGTGTKRIASGTWVLPYSDSLFMLYSSANVSLTRLIKRIDQQPNSPSTISVLVNLSQFF